MPTRTALGGLADVPPGPFQQTPISWKGEMSLDSLCGKRLRLGFNNKRETLSPVRCDYSSPRLIVLRNPTWP